MTQTDLATAVGVTASFISHLEHGRTQASLPLFRRIAAALGVSVSYFLESGGPAAAARGAGSGGTEVAAGPASTPAAGRIRVVKQLTRKIMIDPASDGVRWELLSPDHQRSMEFIMGVYEPGGQVGFPEPITQQGEEGGFVLEGELELTVAGEVYRLQPGDSIYFDSTVPHSIRNVSNVTARAIWVHSPPAF